MMKSLLRLGGEVCSCLQCKIMLYCQQHLDCVRVTTLGFFFAFIRFSVSQRGLPFPYRKDHSEQLGNSSGVSAAAGTALANAETAAGVQHQGWHAGIQILAGQPGHGAEEPRGKHSPPSIKARREAAAHQIPSMCKSIMVQKDSGRFLHGPKPH